MDVEEFFSMPLSMMKRYSAGLLVMFAMTGCASLVDMHYEHSQKLRTEMAYLKFWWHSDESCSSDYKAGWKAGYLDVTTGGDGSPPMFAPHGYWNPAQILAHKDKKRNEWYTGFQDGAMLASLQPDTHYLKVWAPPPACQTPAYYSMENTASEGGPALVPPAESPSLTPTPESTIAPPKGDQLAPSPMPGGTNLPPVPERPMPAQ